MLRKFVFAFVGLATLLPSVAAARDQSIVITEFGFFPLVSYVKPGDTIYFENTSGVAHDLVGTRNGQQEWTLSVPAEATVSMQVNGSFGQAYNSTMETMIGAEISFDDPPVAAQAD